MRELRPKYVKIAHLTSVHSRVDTRIFYKMCVTLAAQGHDVVLIVGDGRGEAHSDGVRIVDVGACNGRIDRIRRAPGRVLSAALRESADIYHLHDPELWPAGLKLKRKGHRVVFDSHEDFPLQMIEKPYWNRHVRWLASVALRRYESWVCRRYDGIIAATPFIREKFLRVNPQTTDVCNYPLLDELTSQTSWQEKRSEVCYVGGIARSRGILEVVDAMSRVRQAVRLNLCGNFSEPDVEAVARASGGWSKVIEHGFVDRAGVRRVLDRSLVGLVTLHPLANYMHGLPVKMFEYMSAGIPVIASNFPLWRRIVEEAGCGVCVDPMKPSEIAQAIDFFVCNPAEARRMGQSGRQAVTERYNWAHEKQKMMSFYERIVGASSPAT